MWISEVRSESSDLVFLKLCDPIAVVHHLLVVLLWQFNCISNNGGVANITGRIAYSLLIKII